MVAKSSKISLPEISPAVFQDASNWFQAHRGELPSCVADVFGFALTTVDHFKNPEIKTRSLLLQLRLALGLIPSSERRGKGRSGKPLDGLPKDEKQKRQSALEKALYQLERAKNLAAWYRKLARRHQKQSRGLEEEIVKLENDLEVLSPAELALAASEEAAFAERLDIGGGRSDLDAAKNAETLMQGAAATLVEEDIDCLVDRDGLPRDAVVTQTFFEERERLSFTFAVTKLCLNVEKVAVKTKAGGPTLVAASLDHIGPAKSVVTWEFLANMTILVSQYAMPLNRFASLVSTEEKTFTAAEMSRYFRVVATQLSPIYLQLAESLADAPIFNGDDTGNRVLEVEKTFKELALNPKTELPWASYATADLAAASLGQADTEGKKMSSLGTTLAASLGFVFDRADGRGGKHGFQTSHVSGRVEPFEPKSTIIFYRSHFGSCGNLMENLLHKRSPDNRRLVIQSDLATVNLIRDPKLKEKFEIISLGCASHARRPFAIHEKDDPELCAAILHAFKGVFIYEQALDAAGRNRDNTLAIRSIDAAAAWSDILSYAKLLAEKWSRETPLGEGARYIIRHFEKLTHYLTDHRLSPSNNFSERMLRMEKLIEDAALFRQTLEGRFALDIVRTILQTAIAAGVDLQAYLLWVLSMPVEVVSKSPSEFTPLAFARCLPQILEVSEA